MAGSATQWETQSVGFELNNEIGTYPQYLSVGGATMTFDTAHPETIIVSNWPYTEAETVNTLGQYFWLFNSAAGQLSYGRWQLNGTTLDFLHIFGSPNFTTNVTAGAVGAIAEWANRRFDVCTVKAASSGVIVNGVPLAASGSIIEVEHGGNSNAPIVINATGAQAWVTNMKQIN